MRLLSSLILCFFAPICLAQSAIVVMGDSLSAAYGIDQEQGWVALLQQRLRERDYDYTVINASISGETTAGGLRRLPKVLQQNPPRLVLIELGGNDGLRGQSIGEMRQNLSTMVRLAQEKGADVLLFEIRIPPNYGPRYTQEFEASFAQISKETGAASVPFFLAQIAEDPESFLDDGIHPNAKAQPALLEAVWPHLEAVLR